MKVFSEQHEMFRAAVRSFVDKEVAPHVEAWEAAGRMPSALWRRMGELGFFGLEYDEKYGGGGVRSGHDEVIVCQARSRGQASGRRDHRRIL